MRHRTFQHSVYPISPGLLCQTINYVTQVSCFFLSFFRALCVSVFLFLFLSLFLSFSFFFFFRKLVSTIMPLLRHQQSEASPCSLQEPGHVLKWCDFVFFGRPLCNLVNAGTLHVGNVSEPSRELRLAHGAHSPHYPAPPVASKPGVLRRSGKVSIATATSGV